MGPAGKGDGSQAGCNLAASLAATDVIDCGHPAIQAKAHDLCAGLSDDNERARAIFTFVRDEITYNFAPRLTQRSDWRASLTLARGNGFCQQKAVLLAALARAVGIPALVCFQHLRDYKLTGRYVELLGSNVLMYHGLTALLLDGCWRRLDPSLDRALVERKGYILVEFRAGADALLAATDLAGNPHFDVVEELGCFPDLPEEACTALLHMVRRGGERWRALVERTHGTM